LDSINENITRVKVFLKVNPKDAEMQQELEELKAKKLELQKRIDKK